MKKTFQLTLAALLLLAAPLARAWTYTNSNALLIFRESGFNDVEFNLGNISQFTNLPSGTTIPVNNWDLNLVTSTFGTDLTEVSLIVVGTTDTTAADRAAWISGNDPSTPVSNVSLSGWQSIYYSIINSIGQRPLTYLVPTAGAQAYSIDPAGTYSIASYDKIVSPNGNFISQFSGNAPFNVEGVAPSSFALWQISPDAVPHLPAKYVGTFTITASGVLTFTAGPLTVVTPPVITGITRSGNISTVSFTTISSGNYWLTYTNSLVGASTNWPVVNGPVVGDGSDHSLTHTNNTDTAGFYRVSRTP